MFSYLRYFAMVGLLLVAVGSLLMSLYFKQISQTDLLETTNQQVVATLSSYAKTVWAQHATRIGKDTAEMQSFLTETRMFFSSQPLAKVTIFSPDISRSYYSSTNAYVTAEDGARTTLFDMEMVLAGQPVMRLLKHTYLSGNTAPRTLVQLIVPLRASTGGPQALAEVYVDVSTHWEELESIQYIIIGIMIGTFLVLVGVLLYTASRAEAIITRQHEVNLELTAAAAQAEAQSRDKSQFLASVSHELRTPLNAIIGFSEIIRNETRDRLDKIYQDYLDDIYASGKHLASLINDILDFSKAEAGKLQVEMGETDVTKIIRNCLRMVMPRAESGQVTLVEEVPIDHLVIVTDTKKLKQVLINLLSNAVKFTRAGGEVRCYAWHDLVSGEIIIEVRDTGIGIAHKDLSRVMMPFGQVDSALSRKYEGTGLGLPLSKKFVESIGGTFAIESELNVGTRVVIRLPKAPPGWENGSDAKQPTEENARVTRTDGTDTDQT